MHTPSFWLHTIALLGTLLFSFAPPVSGADQAANQKPVLLYSRYYNALGETRYLPDGNYKQILQLLRTDFEVRVHSQPLTPETLAGVSVLLISNPSEQAVGTNPPPPHVSRQDMQTLTRFIQQGGGLIIMGNQENHNLEIKAWNRCLSQFGLQFANRYTDAKALALPKETPIIGGLTWAYYTGNLVLIDPQHPAKPRGLVVNDLKQPPIQGSRDEAGILLGIAEPGKGRVVMVTDAGWITDSALDGRGIGDVAIKHHDNWEIMRRLTRWAAHLSPVAISSGQDR